MIAGGLIVARRAARPAAQIAGHSVAFVGVLAAMLALLGACSGSGRYYAENDGGHDAGHTSAHESSLNDAGHTIANSSSVNAEDGGLPADSGKQLEAATSAPTRLVEATTQPDESTAQPESESSSASDETSVVANDTTQAPAIVTCDPTGDECGGGYCTPELAECVARTDARGEGTRCDAHEQCASGLACGYIGDPQRRELACLRLGYSDADCGGALGRIKFGVGITALADASGTELGLCIGDIR